MNCPFGSVAPSGKVARYEGVSAPKMLQKQIGDIVDSIHKTNLRELTFLRYQLLNRFWESQDNTKYV